MAHRFILFLTFLIVLCFPSANLQLFDGLPASRLPEFAALVFAVSFLILSELRDRQRDFWARLRIRPAHLWILLAAMLLLKGALFAFGEPDGFTGCYRSPAEPTIITHEDLPASACERSYDDLFNRSSATRMDSRIWFGSEGWNLVFLNTSRYNYYDWEAGNILRTRIPIEAHWSGYPDVGGGETVRIEYVGEGTVAWGDIRASLPPAYDESNVVEIGTPRDDSPLRIDYSFDDGSRSGQDPQSWGPRAAIKVGSGTSGRMVPLAARPASIGFRLLALLADGLILLWILSCLPAVWMSVRRDLVVLVAFAVGIGFFSLVPAAPLLRGIGITCVLAAALIAHIAFRPFRAVSVYFLVVAAGFAMLRVWSSGYGQVLLRSAGNDPLNYESQAYSILATGSLRGGESVFYNVPAYRYIKFLEHVLFGDGDMLYAGVQLAAFFGGVFWLFRDLRSRVLPAINRILLAGLGCGLVFLGGYYVSQIIREGLSEYDSWILLLWALPALYGMATGGEILAGTVALAVAYTIRPDLILGILWILFLATIGRWRKHAKRLALAGILALGIALLPLAHNIYFGQQWVPTTVSSNLSVNLVLPPSTWLAFLQGDSSAAAAVREQMGMLFLIADAPQSALPTLAVMAVLLISWLGVIGSVMMRRRTSDIPWLAVPIFFLSVHIFYVVNTYYPRHIVVSYLSMAIVTVLVLARERRLMPPAAGPAVELPRKQANGR